MSEITDKDREAAIKFATESEEDSPWHATNDGFLAGCEHVRAEQGVPTFIKLDPTTEQLQRENAYLENIKMLMKDLAIINEENAKLKAQLWVAKDSALRTWDGSTERYDAALAVLNKIERQSRTRGYPTGSEWSVIADAAKQVLSAIPK